MGFNPEGWKSIADPTGYSQGGALGKWFRDSGMLSGAPTYGAPPPPDFAGAAEKQGAASKQAWQDQNGANRPNQYNPWGSSTWEQGANGQWTQRTTLDPADQQRLDAQRAQQMGIYGKTNEVMGNLDTGPLDFGGLPSLTSGDAARQQAIDAAYKQSASRLDPMYRQREENLKSDLVNQGLDPSSEAAQSQFGLLGRDRNDAYQGAMNSAIGQGAQAGQALFNQSLASRQQGMSELLRKHDQGYEDFGRLFGSQMGVGAPQFQQFHAAGQYGVPDWLGAAEAAGQYGLGATEANNRASGIENANRAGGIKGLGDTAGGIAKLIAMLMA